MKVRRRVFTVRASRSANVDGPTFKPETELGLLLELGGGAGATGGGAPVAILGTGMGAVFIELLPVKLGMGKSLGGTFGFCCTHVTTVGIKLVKAATISDLQAAIISAFAFSIARATFSSIVT